MIIRHEINLLSGFKTGSDFVGEKVFVDASKYSGTCTMYLEFVAINSGSSATVTLNSLSAFNTTVPTSATYTVYRSSGVSMGSGTAEYSLGYTSTNLSIKGARIIIIQDTGSNPLTASQSQFEIGTYQSAVAVTTTNTLQKLAAPKYWRYNSDNYDGACTFYGEVTALVSSTTGNKTIVIQEATSAEPTATWSTVATMVSASSMSTTATRYRSSAFTPVNGRYYRLAWTNSSSMTTVSIYNAKIIVDQVANSVATTYAFTGTPNDIDGTWTNENLAFDLDDSTAATVPFTVGQSTVSKLEVTGTGAPTSGGSITSVALRLILDFPSPGSGLGMDIVIKSGSSTLISSFMLPNGTSPQSATIPAPAGGWTWAAVAGLYLSLAPRAGGATSGTYSLYAAEIVVTTPDTTGITKTEEHYLLANTTLAAGTALQNFLTKWDSAEWSGVTNTYVHQVDAGDNDTSVVEIDTAAGTQLTGSVVSSPDNYKALERDAVTGTVTTFRDVYGDGAGASYERVAQGFTPSVSYNAVAYVSLLLTMSPSSVGDSAFVEIRSGSVTGTLLGTSELVSGSSMTTNTYIKFYFSTSFALSSGTKYFIILRRTVANASSGYSWRGGSVSYAGGGYVSMDSGVWGTEQTESTNDLFFIVSDLITMPANGNLDVKATTNSGNVYGSRIIARVVKQAATVSNIDAVGYGRAQMSIADLSVGTSYSAINATIVSRSSNESAQLSASGALNAVDVAVTSDYGNLRAYGAAIANTSASSFAYASGFAIAVASANDHCNSFGTATLQGTASCLVRDNSGSVETSVLQAIGSLLAIDNSNTVAYSPLSGIGPITCLTIGQAACYASAVAVTSASALTNASATCFSQLSGIAALLISDVTAPLSSAILSGSGALSLTDHSGGFGAATIQANANALVQEVAGGTTSTAIMQSVGSMAAVSVSQGYGFMNVLAATAKPLTYDVAYNADYATLSAMANAVASDNCGATAFGNGVTLNPITAQGVSSASTSSALSAYGQMLVDNFSYASENVTLSSIGYLVATGFGASSVSAQIGQRINISALSTGFAQYYAQIRAASDFNITSFGQSLSFGVLSATGALNGNQASNGLVLANISGLTALFGAAGGSSQIWASIESTGALSGFTDGTSISNLTVFGIGNLTVFSIGASTASASAAGRGAMVAQVQGISVGSALIDFSILGTETNIYGLSTGTGHSSATLSATASAQALGSGESVAAVIISATGNILAIGVGKTEGDAFLSAECLISAVGSGSSWARFRKPYRVEYIRGASLISQIISQTSKSSINISSNSTCNLQLFEHSLLSDKIADASQIAKNINDLSSVTILCNGNSAIFD